MRKHYTLSQQEAAQLAAAIPPGLSESDYVRQLIAAANGWKWPVLYRKPADKIKPESVKRRERRRKQKGEIMKEQDQNMYNIVHIKNNQIRYRSEDRYTEADAVQEVARMNAVERGELSLSPDLKSAKDGTDSGWRWDIRLAADATFDETRKASA